MPFVHTPRWFQRALGRFFDQVYVNGGRYCCFDQTPYLQEHATPDQRAVGFDWLLYQVMIDDKARVAPYRRDIEALVAGRTVLEIGPGPTALLTRIAAEAGAAEIVSVEANDWVADEAERQMAGYGDRVRVVTRHSDDLVPADTGGRTHFDVLLLECYHAIASQERVVESVNALRSRGFTFDTVISRGFTTVVAPAAGPPAARMSPVERFLMGWPMKRAEAETAMTQRFGSMHGDMQLIAGRRLAPPQRWQAADLQDATPVDTAQTLTFEVERAEDYAGLQFSNVFHFHTGELDTGATSTDWGVYFVPLPIEHGHTGRATLTLTTHCLDPERPSLVELRVELAGVDSEPLRL